MSVASGVQGGCGQQVGAREGKGLGRLKFPERRRSWHKQHECGVRGTAGRNGVREGKGEERLKCPRAGSLWHQDHGGGCREQDGAREGKVEGRLKSFGTLPPLSPPLVATLTVKFFAPLFHRLKKCLTKALLALHFLSPSYI